MNYYKRHLGDYARDTGHLSALEHGVYNLLLDWYYINERPIPADKAIRIAKGNRMETETVLAEFFFLTDEGWRHSRADREICDYQSRAEANRIIGKLGGRPRKTQTVSERKPNGNPNVTLATSHKPLANTKEEASRPALPDWLPLDVWKDWSDHRGKKFTKRAKTLALTRLEELHRQGHNLRACVDNSIESGWSKVFPPKDDQLKVAPRPEHKPVKEALAPTESKEERAAAWKRQMESYGVPIK